ncbi:unnamed protein product [Ilex paraguariensis]|uniref:COP9 signalosome complex subunit 5 n=1 Tax=Ilex paraguariensis TaxID=185542 RepID=A0ABC8R1M9_9AQUA
MLNQQFQEPFLAVVIDPTRTVSAGKVEIGAFRTYPEDYKPPDEPVSEYQTIPLNKIEDFGVHCKQYYALDITYFKSSLDCRLLDLLWNKYWVNTLSSSPLLGNGDYVAGQISDLAEKLEQAENHLAHSRFGSLIAPSQRKKESTFVVPYYLMSGPLAKSQETGSVDKWAIVFIQNAPDSTLYM